MFSLIPTFVVAIVFVVVLAIAARRGTWGRAIEIPASHEAAAETAIRGVRVRMLAVFAVFVVLAVLITTDAFGVQPAEWLGIGQSLGPGVAAAVGLAVLSIAPLRAWADSSGVRSAELTRRGSASFGPRWGFTLPLASAILLIAFLIVAGISSSADSYGLSRFVSVAFSGGTRNMTAEMTTDPTQWDVTGSAGPYPGWFYGIPLIAVTVLLAIVVLVALHRISSALRPADVALYPLDDALRRALTRFVMLLSSSALLLYFAASMFFAGRATSSAATSFGQVTMPEMPVGKYTSFSQAATFTYGQPLYAIGVTETVIGVVFGGVALVLLVGAGVVAAVRWAPSVGPLLARRVTA